MKTADITDICDQNGSTRPLPYVRIAWNRKLSSKHLTDLIQTGKAEQSYRKFLLNVSIPKVPHSSLFQTAVKLLEVLHSCTQFLRKRSVTTT
jgi:hypothetical protein